MGVMPGIKAFTAAVIGGIGNLYGAAAGGFVIGVLENAAAFYLPAGYKDAVAFVILILLLLFRPSGIFTTAEQEAERI